MKVLVAAKALAVFEALQRIEDVEYEEALFTGQIYEAIPSSQLVIIDYEDVVEHPYDVRMIRELLAESNVRAYSSEEFLLDPGKCIREAEIRPGSMTRLPEKYTIAFVSYSGGTGRTTLALDTALHFARQTEKHRQASLPVMLIEFTYGESAFASIASSTRPSSVVFTWIATPGVCTFTGWAAGLASIASRRPCGPSSSDLFGASSNFPCFSAYMAKGKYRGPLAGAIFSRACQPLGQVVGPAPTGSSPLVSEYFKGCRASHGTPPTFTWSASRLAGRNRQPEAAAREKCSPLAAGEASGRTGTLRPVCISRSKAISRAKASAPGE